MGSDAGCWEGMAQGTAEGVEEGEDPGDRLGSPDGQEVGVGVYAETRERVLGSRVVPHSSSSSST